MAYLKTASGLTIHYQYADSNKPVLVMLHGLGSGLEIWQPQIEAFRENYRILFLDFPGHGQSDDLIRHTIGKYSNIVAELLEYLNIAQVHIMALSLGCSVALDYCLHHSKKVLSLTLQGPVGALTPPWLPWAWPKMVILILYLTFMSILSLLIGKSRAAWLINIIPIQAKTYHPLLACLNAQVSASAIICLTLQTAYPAYIGKLHRIKMPVFVIYGKGDMTPRRYYDYVFDHLAGRRERAEVQGGKHILSSDNPEEYNRLCLQFLASVD